MKTRISRCRLVGLLLLAGALIPTARADDWPQWLGPNRDAISVERGASRLLPEPKRIWTNAVGLGVSSMVVSGGRAFTLGHVKGEAKRGTDTVYCLAVSTGEVLWRHSYDCRTCVSQDVLIHDGHLYGIDNTGTDLQGNDNSRSRLKCLALETGEEKWLQERFGWSNLILFDGKLLILRQVGELVTADASPQDYRELARHPLLDGRSWTVPALANGCLFVRNNAGAVACYQLLQQP